MPATKKRIRPVIEEVVETPVKSASHAHARVRVEEEAPAVPVETVQEVARYDEPAQIEAAPVEHEHKHVSAEAQAREFLGDSHEPDRRMNVKLIFFVTVITALIVGFIAGGVYVYISGVSNIKTETDMPTPTPIAEESMAPVQTASPSPTPTVKLDTLSVNVLNGSGVIGAAGKVKASLEAGGFKVSGTGNAANYNFKDTTIQVKVGTPQAVVDALKKALKEYVVEVGDELPASSKFDVVVTAGKQ